MQITIDKDVPMPGGWGTGPQSKYPFAQMEVGDSFALELDGKRDGTGDQRVAAKLRAAAAAHAQRHGVRFSTRTIKADNTIRCWRVS